MKTTLLIAALVLAPAASVFAQDVLTAREETRRSNYVTINPEAAVDAQPLLKAGGVWPANKIVIPGKGADSVLVKILLGSVTPQMPLRSPAWSPEKIAAVKSWIDKGALEADFVKDIQPQFKQSCAGCHSPASHAAGLVLDSFATIQTTVVGH